MKSYEEFTKEIAETINNRREELFPNFKNVTVELNEVTKSNDEAHVGLVIRKEGSNMSPNIYLEDYYSDFQSGDTMEEIIDRIANETRFLASCSMLRLTRFILPISLTPSSSISLLCM